MKSNLFRLTLFAVLGAFALNTAVAGDADKVCGVDNMRVTLDIVRVNRACVAGAINGAISDVDDARLTHLHELKLAEVRQS